MADDSSLPSGGRHEVLRQCFDSDSSERVKAALGYTHETPGADVARWRRVVGRRG
jgi:hypothetical protein